MTSIHDLLFVDPSPAARRLLWQVLAIGRSICDEPVSYRGRDKSGILLIWVRSGRGQLLSERIRWNLYPGSSCWIVDLTRTRTYIPTSKRLVVHGMRFNSPNLESWFKLLGGGGEFQFPSPAGVGRLQRTHQSILELVRRRPVNFEWKVHEEVTRVMGQLLALRKVLGPALRPAVPPRPVARVLQAVLSDPASVWRAAELAEVAGISYSGLRSLFRQSQHEGLSEFLRRVRLDRARALLLDERMSIKEVARELRFANESYFSEWFHRLAGATPSHFRQDHREP